MPTRASAYSSGLANSLKTAGRSITDTAVRDLWHHTEAKRGEWVCAAIQLGISLLAKQAALGPRKFTPWLRELSGQRVNQIDGSSMPTFKSYMYLARRYLVALDAGPKIDARHSLAIAVQEHAQLAAQVSDLPALAADTAKLTPSIQAFVGGRSLRQLLTDLREAEKDADEAESEDSKTLDARTGQPVDGDTGTPAQMEFDLEKLWQKDVAPTIDRNFQTVITAAAKLPSDKVAHYWQSVATDLKAKAELAADYARAASAHTAAAPVAPLTTDQALDEIL